MKSLSLRGWLLVLTCCAASYVGLAHPVMAMGNHSDVLRDQYGRAIGGATVTIYVPDSFVLATIYSDNGVTQKSNPFLTDAIDGSFNFYAENGVYDIVYNYPGVTFDPAKTARISVIDGSEISTGGGGGGGVTGWPTVSTTKEVTWANALANALKIGDGTDAWAFYRDPTDGLQLVCVIAGVANDCNYIRKLASGKYWGITDSSGNAVFSVLPSGATPKAQYPFGTGHYPLKSVFVGAYGFEGDGTNCPARPTPVTINSGPKVATYICTENNASRLVAAFPMRQNWDGGVIYIRPYYVQTAVDTGSVFLDVAAACRGMGETFNGTYGTEVSVDDTSVTGSNAIDSTLSGAITPNGTCAAGDYLYFYIDIDGTGNPTTAAATLHLLGADVVYSVTSLSE